MRLVLIVILTLGFISLSANEGVEKVMVEIELKENSCFVKESILINLSDSSKKLRLRALTLDGSQMVLDSVHVNHEAISQEIMQINPTLDIEVNVPPENNSIDIYYHLINMEEEYSIPIFFTSLIGLNSELDFFKATIKSTIDKMYGIKFPLVPFIEKESGLYKTVSFQLPATPSMIRMVKVQSLKQMNSIKWVDWGVGLVFIFIGFLLWINRKKLAYG